MAAVRLWSGVESTKLAGVQPTYLVSGRVLVVATGYAIVIWLGRNYRAARHLASVYEHRRLSLETFETLRDMASASPETKAAVTQEMVKAIFPPAVTGYLGGNENIPMGPVADVLKAVK